MDTIGRGFWSGILATGSMTSLMFEIYQKLPASEKSPLAPATIAEELLKVVFPTWKLTSEQRQHLTLIAHMGYGALSGILYSVLANTTSEERQNAIIQGNVFGILIWAASYKGWLPSLNFRASADRTPFRRNAMMITSHLLWGTFVALADQKLNINASKMLDGVRKASGAE